MTAPTIIMRIDEEPGCPGVWQVALSVDGAPPVAGPVQWSPSQTPLLAVAPHASDAASRGEALWERWLAGDLGGALLSSLYAAVDDGARLAICAEDSRVLALPWELLRYGGDYPVQSRGVAVWRICGALGAEPPAPPPVGIWCGLASPLSNPIPMNEHACVKEINRLVAQCGIYADPGPTGGVTDEPTEQDFLSALQTCEIVYLIGHGSLDPPELTLCDPADPSGRRVGASSVAQRLGGAVRLLVLNCCHGAEVARAAFDYWRTYSQGAPLGLPTILAMQWQWPGPQAHQFHQSLTDRLGREMLGRGPRPLSAALADFRRAASNAQTDLTWAAPALFAPGPVDGPEDLDAREQPVRMTARVPASGPGSHGPIGLTRAQASRVCDAIAVAEARGHFRGRAPVMGMLGEFAHQHRSVARALPAFSIDAYPVSRQMWRQVMGGDPPGRAPAMRPGTSADAAPAMVTAEEAQGFCARVGARLPTREEWERAARGSREGLLPWTPDGQADALDRWSDATGALLCNVREAGTGGLTGIFDTGAGGGEFGVHDMVGNVPEWAIDSASGRRVVMGRGERFPLVANIPSYSWSPTGDPKHARFGFRCVRDAV